MTDPAEAERKRQSIAQELRERRDAVVDKYTVAWLQQQLAAFHQELIGFTRTLLRHGNDITALEGRGTKSDDRIKELETLNKEKDAIIGQLMARVVMLESRVEDMAKWAATKGKKNTDQKWES